MPVAFEVNEQEGWEGAVFQFENDDPDYVMSFQRTLRPEAQDAAAGMDTVAVSYYGATAYGAVAGWDQSARDEIRLTLTAAAAQALDTDEVTDIVVEGVEDLTLIYEHVRGMLVATGEWRGADGQE